MDLEDLEALARAAIADCAFYKPPVKWNEEALSYGDEAAIPGVAYGMRDKPAAFIAAANPAAVLALVQRLRAAEAIVRALAKEERIRNEGHGYLLCEHCHAYVERGDPKTHDESCLHRRAVEYKAT
jgi:cytochrome c5